MTLFLDGPVQAPVRRAEDIRSAVSRGREHDHQPETPAPKESPMPTPKKDQIMAALRRAAPRSVRRDALVDVYGGSKDAFRVLMSRLVREGLAEKTEDGFRVAATATTYHHASADDSDDNGTTVDDGFANDDESDGDSTAELEPDEQPDDQEDEPEAPPVMDSPAERRPVRLRFVSFEVEGDLESGELVGFLEQLRAAMLQG